MDNAEKFLDELKKVLSIRDGRPVTTESRLRDDLNLTSLHYFAMIGAIEELTGRSISYDQIKCCSTVADAIELLKVCEQGE